MHTAVGVHLVNTTRAGLGVVPNVFPDHVLCQVMMWGYHCPYTKGLSADTFPCHYFIFRKDFIDLKIASIKRLIHFFVSSGGATVKKNGTSIS